MQTGTQTARVSNKSLWTGRIISALTVLFLLFDSFGKLLKLPPVVTGTIQIGFPESSIRGIGIALLICTIAYIVPRTSILGAILLTGYLGGAVAANVRIGSPLFTYVLFPVYVGILVWLGLWLRDPLLREFVPVRKRGA